MAAAPPPGGQPPYGQPPYGQPPYGQPPWPDAPYVQTAPGEPPPLWLPHYGCTPIDAVKRYFRKYADFGGRASRAEYWWIALVDTVVYLGLALLGVLAGLPGSTTTADGEWTPGPGFFPFGILLVIWMLGIIVPSIAVTVRRLHDANLSGWFYLLLFIPYLGGLALLVLTVLPPKPEGRRFDRPVA